MCGIAGVFAYNTDQIVEKDVVINMRDVMTHRGPDGAGIWISSDERVGLAHRRLSIIDLSDIANQPMSNEDDSIWVLFNGEIYNHDEIRQTLEKMGGHQWKTDHSDTEVILHAYETWGIDFLHKLRGMFSIALWDGREQTLWLIRDRIGIKPLYYTVTNGQICFASEIKALLQHPDVTARVNEDVLYAYLSFLTTPAPQTLFEGIYKLEPGTWMRCKRDGDITTHRYYELWDHVQETQKNEDELAEEILDTLRTAVKLRKVSDVPVGVFLSGGIDSSTNTALFSEDATDPVKTFSIGYEGDTDYQTYTNELHFARQMAQSVGAEAHELLLTVDDLLDFLPRMVYLQDEPIADPVCVPVYYVSKLARENGVTVSQVGEGADELFWGYPSWKDSLNLQKNTRYTTGNACTTRRMGLAANRTLLR
ncbi:MAG: asparagine synthase (glutamine-hydrolyzing), partial [Phototrophicaceae bacterium]